MTKKHISLKSALILSIASTLALSACGNSASKNAQKTVPYEDIDPDFKISVTTDFESPTRISKAVFLPNLIAGWASQIVTIDTDGALLRTQMGTLKPVEFETGPYIDIHGLGRKGEPGVLLALTDDNRLQAFIESSDAGDFTRIPVSIPDIKIKRFCKTDDFVTPQFSVYTDKNEIVTLDIMVEENKQVTIHSNDTAEALNCYKDKLEFGLSNQTPDQNYLVINPNVKNPHLRLDSKAETKFLEIKDGLSIRGIKDPNSIAVTDINLGSTFSQGAILITDRDSARSVLIAWDYFTDVVNAEMPD